MYFLYILESYTEVISLESTLYKTEIGNPVQGEHFLFFSVCSELGTATVTQPHCGGIGSGV